MLKRIGLLPVLAAAISFAAIPAFFSKAEENTDLIGGGYAVTGQIPNASYFAEIYDATNGLPTSDANYILGSSDGYIWIGGYSGIMRYDGTFFEKMDTAEGLTSGRAIFEDSKGRIWVATNDNGVVILDGEERTHLTYKEGLPSSSIRIFAETPDGDIYIGTTAGVCYADDQLALHIIDDERINEERILKLETDLSGRIYGQSANGIIFAIEDHQVSELYSGSELGMEKITTILADPDREGMVYLGTEGDVVYHGYFGAPAERMQSILVAPLKNTHWMSYECGRVWLTSTSVAGYLEGDTFHVISDIPMNSAIEMMTSDFQGNLWFASSTQGVMKVVTNSFVNLTNKAGLKEEVTNAACLYQNRIYIGTDNGLRIIDHNGNVYKDDLVRYIDDSRVRCIQADGEGNLWLSVYNNERGIVCYTKDGEIVNYTTHDGMPGNEIRCSALSKDGGVIVGTNDGLAVIRDGKVERVIDAKSGIKNTVILTLEEGDKGEIYAGSDGDGIYIIDPDNTIRRMGRDEGLTSDVILRIKKDEDEGIIWIVTSNSIQYLKNGVIRQVTSFPYNNNYDLFFDHHQNVWILSSYGIYMVRKEDMLMNRITDYRLYTTVNGLTGTPTANLYSAHGEDGSLYIPVRNGLCMVNIDHMQQGKVPVKSSMNAIYSGDERILPNEDGTYIIPNTAARVRIFTSVLDYTMTNPKVHIYFEGYEEDGIDTDRANLTGLEYTGLPYGSYVLHVKAYDDSGNELVDDAYHIVKKATITELPMFRLLLFVAVGFLVGFIVWRVVKGTVIQRQYEEIRQAKEEAERANTAKTSFFANMSHEIRTPINTIMGMNEMVMREDATGVPKPYFLSMMNYAFDIRNASESLLSLVNDLLDMSKIESGKMHLVEQEYDTQDVLRSVVAMVRGRSAEKELTFDVVIDEVLPKRLYGDAGKIKQIVLNLLTNAVKYTPSGGFVLNVEMLERKDDECQLRISVKDTGMGIKAEDMGKIFTAYERLDEDKNSGIQGTGLGLDISSKFAQLLGGSLTCESVYGKGSEFVLLVRQKIIDKTPLGVFIEHDESQAKGPYVPQFIAPDADILVVDDTLMNLNVIKSLLKPTRVFVSTAMSGEECLEKIKDTHFDVVLLDHMMPGMDGVETMEKIREIDPDLPVYALTANTAMDEKFYKSKGFNGYLTKPVDSEILERTIMKHLPDEIMEKPNVEELEEDLQEIPENLSWLYDTKGISVPDGIRNSGGINNYIFSLNLFLETIDSNAEVIRSAYDSGNIRLYTIKVHALKSSARIIGAEGLSQLAASLEEAGNREDQEFIDENTGRLLSEYEEYREKLAGLREEAESGDKPSVPDEMLKDAYAALSDVIPQMDYDSVEMILDSLSEYTLPPEDDARVKEIGKLLKTFDWDRMEELIGGI